MDLPLASLDFSTIVAELSAFRGARVWSSPLTRCRRLAEALTPHPILDDRLLELSFGDWEGVLWDDVPRADLDRWALDLYGFAAPGGETGASLIARVTAFWRDLGEGSHIVVSHGGPLRVLIALAEGRPVDLANSAPRLGSVTVFAR
jgi:alpha-ribazole phosphatase